MALRFVSFSNKFSLQLLEELERLMELQLTKEHFMYTVNNVQAMYSSDALYTNATYKERIS